MYADVINDWKGLFAAFDVLFTVLAFGGIGALLRLPYPKGPHGASRSPEENRLFKKFANGEIDDDEYRRCRETIRISADAARPAADPFVGLGEPRRLSAAVGDGICPGLRWRSHRRPHDALVRVPVVAHVPGLPARFLRPSAVPAGAG